MLYVYYICLNPKNPVVNFTESNACELYSTHKYFLFPRIFRLALLAQLT